MRKRAIFLSFVVVLLTTFSSFVLSHYYSAPTIIKEKTVCTTPIKNGETIFESVVKQFVGAVSSNK